jgi:FkbM family methyltransferase
MSIIPAAGVWNSHYENARYNCPYLDENSCVLDLGGYMGEFALKIQEKYGCDVHVYEPIHKYCDIIEEKLNSKIYVNRFALGSSSGKEQILLSGEGTTLEKYDRRNNNSHKGSPGEDIKSSPSDEIDVVDILDEIKKYDEIDLMKINVEGTEYEILPILIESGDIEKVKNLQVQFHSFVDNGYEMYVELKNNLSESHELLLDSVWKWSFWKRRKND